MMTLVQMTTPFVLCTFNVRYRISRQSSKQSRVNCPYYNCLWSIPPKPKPAQAQALSCRETMILGRRSWFAVERRRLSGMGRDLLVGWKYEAGVQRATKLRTSRVRSSQSAGILGAVRTCENSGELPYISANIRIFFIFEHSYILYSSRSIQKCNKKDDLVNL